ncbi:GPI ethanolamine phosphate transferase 3 [Aspergillus vadensis CBS 113365]|uniref:GPI ethanolamine phosphate transferase 3 n=1 Tax=Aspergillus vadensis (strain CBS 113365 / IMI 142717 / IBT 24658) TaxID=1448311 RepID=A0A319CE17_ASPVC|nr:GPI ethanolamine phosphate transferase 3 [Aspergillus vadensis CBS 113365]PYH73578.1 GPI ethanolamine phosphate transferase 3 [Aspergillus vadensis CBS 113365]
MGPSTTTTSRWHLPLFFLYILLLHTTGLYLFTKGFLLTRQTLDLKSNCSHPPIPIITTTNTTTTTCWIPPTFTKAIILLIDALRYDFTIPTTSTTNNKTYHNALTILHTTALTTPHNALLYPFIADPPTTTLQRLKALTTGTLPTFIEAGSNFAGSAVTEDNLISQLHDAGKRLVLLGDDTWMKLFPGYFDPTLSRPYESFLVEDLHTVDDGVYEHLVPLLKGKIGAEGEWDVIIAHFLGVDHVGHRFGPGHESMRDKLAQMDGIVKRVMESVDDETLLVVMGDHGMDENGNHGGETGDEVRTALWMYSTREVWGVVDGDGVTGVVGRDTPQVDFVSTLALLMGVPVPFSNLGRPIEEAFAGREGRDWRRLVEVNALVGAQIQRFTMEYERYGWEGVVGWDGWYDGEVDFGDEEALREYYQRLRGYQGRMLEGYRRMWAQFDPLKMVEGMMVLLLSVVILVCPQVDERSGLRKWSGMVVGIVMGIVTVAGHVALADFAQCSLTDGVILGAALGSVVWNMWQTGLTILRRCLPEGVWSWQAVMFTLLLGIGFASNSYTIWEDRVVLVFLSTFGLCTLGASNHAKGVREASCSAIFMLLSRVVSLSRACREEQLPFCRTSFYRLESSWVWQLSSTVITAVAVLYITRLALQDRTAGNLFWFRLGIPSALLLTTVFNALETASNNDWLADLLTDDISKTLRMTVAQMVLVIVFIGLATALTTIPRHRPLERALIFMTAMLLAGILSSTPTAGLSLAVLYYQLISLRHLVPSNSSIKPTIAALLGTLHFFSTGHNATLSSIQWKSAYIPFRDTQYPWSPLLVIVNTFGAPIVAACAVPLLHSGDKQSQAHFLAIHSTVYTVWAAFTALWACILRRHLMLFAIFCPRFLMAGTLLVIVDVLALLNPVILTTESGLRVEGSDINSSI